MPRSSGGIGRSPRFVRRVQEVGGGTLMVSLPKEWALKVGLRRGSEVVAQEAPGGILLIYPPTPTPPTRCLASYAPDQVGSTLDAILEAYLGGCDVLNLTCRKRLRLEDRRAIKKLMNLLVGSEIIEEGDRTLKIQFLVDVGATNPYVLLERMIRSASNMLLDAMISISLGDEELADLVIERDDEIDKSYFLLVRTLRKASQDLRALTSGELAPMELLDLRVAALLTEGIADRAVDLAVLARKGLKVDLMSLKPLFEDLFHSLGLSGGERERRRRESVRELHKYISDRLSKMLAESSRKEELIALERLLSASRAVVDLADLLPSSRPF